MKMFAATSIPACANPKATAIIIHPMVATPSTAKAFAKTIPRETGLFLKCLWLRTPRDLLFRLITDHEEGFHAWLVRNETDYLIFPEALGGQTVFDLTNRKFASNYNAEDEFIWGASHLSPS